MGKLYLYCSLPPIEMGVRPKYSSKELFEAMEMNLSASARQKVNVMRLWIDLNNLYASYFSGQFDVRGLYTKSSLSELIASEEGFPSYVFEFLSKYPQEEEQRKHFPELLSRYFQVELKNASGFLREFLEFERRWRVVMAGYRAKRLGLSLAEELQFEDLEDETVAMVLAQSGSSGKFIFPYDFADLETKLEEVGSNPKKQYYILAKYRFDFYTTYLIDEQFTLAAIMAYMMRLWILEDYFSLNHDEGANKLDEIVESRDAS